MTRRARSLAVAAAQCRPARKQSAARTATRGRIVPRRRWLIGCWLAAAAMAGCSAAAAEKFSIHPSLSLRGTFTDNVTLEPDELKKSDFATEISPSIRIDANGTRVKGHLVYQLTEVLYARDSSHNNTQNVLTANGTLEAIERFFFIDARGNISQAVASPFGPRPESSASFSTNRTEVRTFEASPYVRGTISEVGEYELRYRFVDARADVGDLGRTRVQETTFRIAGPQTTRPITWSGYAAHTVTHLSGFETVHLDAALARVYYVFDPDLRVFVIGGAERNDYTTEDMVTRARYGLGAEWNPTRRTRASAVWERRFFGNRWEVAATHRTRLLTLSLNESRDVTTEADRRLSLSSTVAYDLLFNALASRFPDPAQRAIETQRLLQERAIPPDLGLPLDFVSSGVFVNHRQQVSLALNGLRNTAAFSVFRDRRQELARSSFAQEAAFAATTDLGASVALGHQLTRHSGVTAVSSWRRTSSSAENSPESRQWDVRLLYNTLLGRDITLLFELRHVRFDSDAGGAGDVRENAATASVLIPF